MSGVAVKLWTLFVNLLILAVLFAIASVGRAQGPQRLCIASIDPNTGAINCVDVSKTNPYPTQPQVNGGAITTLNPAPVIIVPSAPAPVYETQAAPRCPANPLTGKAGVLC